MSNELTPARSVFDELHWDPEYRAELEHSFLAEKVALEVAAYRARHGLTQAELAARLSMKKSAITRLEAAEHEPSMTMLQRLAVGLGVRFEISVAPGNSEATVGEVA